MAVVLAVRAVLAAGLRLLGIEPLETMQFGASRPLQCNASCIKIFCTT
jgi:hypothetical protein